MATPAAVLSVLVQAKGIAETNRKLKDIQDTSERTAKSTEKLEGRFSRLDSTVGDFNRTFTASGNVMKLVKFPALIAGAGLAAQAVGALGAGAIALGSALAPLTGLAAAGAAGYVAMGQAAGVVKLATMGLTKALGGNKEALKALPPAGKDLVKLLNGLKPKLKDLQQTAAAGLLPGLAEGVKAALPALRPLKNIVSGTAGVLGDLAAQAGKLVGSKGVLRDVTTIGHTNVGVIRNLGTAALILAHAFVGVVAEAGPLVTWLSKGAVQLARWVDGQVAAGRESGKLAGFLEQTRTVASTLGHILVNLGAALYNIGKAAAPLGRDLLGQFEKLTEKFRAWTESARGKNQVATYFRNAKGPLLEVFGLVGDLAGALLRISQGKGAQGLINQLRTLVPIFENVVTSTTAAFGPALIDALGNVLRLFGLMAGSSGPLVQLVRLIGLIAGGLADLLQGVPGLNSMAVSFVGLYGTLKAVSFVFGPVVAGAKALEVALIGQTTAANLATAATIRERVSMLATATAMYVSAAATGVMTAATVALDAAIAVLTSPITLVIAGLVALAAAVIYAYKHSDTFRGIVDAMWATLKTVAGWLITVGVAAFNAVADAVKAAWSVVKTVTETVWNGLKVFLDGIWRAVKTLVTTYFDGYKSVITGVWSAVQTVTTTVWGALKGFLVGAWGAIKTVAVTVWDSIKGAILSPIRAVRDAFTGKDGLWAKIRDDAEKGWEKIKGGAAAFADALAGAIEGAFEGAVNKVIDFVNAIIGVINKIPGVPNIGKVAHIGGKPGNGPNISPDKKARGGLLSSLAKGAMVPGSGSGDKVPLHVGGRLAAMVEPGEFVSVANRNATAALMGVNSAVPRYAFGGVLKGALEHATDFIPGAGLIKGAGKYLDMLPGTDSLGWLKGLGSYALDHVKKWIKEQIGSVFSGGGGGGGGPVPSGSVRGWLTKALKITGHFSGANLSALFGRTMQESGGNPRAINLWDINAQQGHPSKGLLQTIDSTFASYMLPGHGNIWNPVDNAIAAIRYMFAAYGHIVGPSSTGYAKGGIVGGSGLPFLGSYHNGGVAPREGLAHVTAGERMTPSGGGPLVHIEHAEFGSNLDVNSFAAKLAWKVATA